MKYTGTDSSTQEQCALHIIFTEKVDETIQAIKEVHPYEEPVINALPIYRTSF